MPIYEYQCQDCEHRLEAIQKVTDIALKVCPACGKQSLKKLVSAAAFHLKGTGWYETDFKGKRGDETGKDESPKKTGDNKPADKISKSDSEKSSKKESTSTLAD